MYSFHIFLPFAIKQTSLPFCVLVSTRLANWMSLVDLGWDNLDRVNSSFKFLIQFWIGLFGIQVIQVYDFSFSSQVISSSNHFEFWSLQILAISNYLFKPFQVQSVSTSCWFCVWVNLGSGWVWLDWVFGFG